MNHNRLLIGIVIGALAGIACGWFAGPAMVKIAWLGDMFLDALKMTIVPLIIAAVISGIASMGDVRKLGRIGSVTVLYYLCTTALAVLTGMILVNIIQPGSGVTQFSGTLDESLSGKAGVGLADIVRSLVTPNLVGAATDMQLLPIIVFCLVFAAALTTVGEVGRPVTRFFDGLNEVMMKLVIWIMYFAPVGIFALIAAKLGAAGGGPAFWREVSSVGWYCFTVLIGLALHFCVLVAILFLVGRRGRTYLLSIMRALLTAFGTASSSATLPLSIECAIEGGADPRAVRFVLPLGATVNMDGTALYEAVAVMFIAQAYGISMGATEQILIFITATLAAIGAAGIPQAGLVTMIIVLTAVNLPVEGIGLLLAVDWFLDRFRTVVNVMGDCVGATVVERLGVAVTDMDRPRVAPTLDS